MAQTKNSLISLKAKGAISKTDTRAARCPRRSQHALPHPSGLSSVPSVTNFCPTPRQHPATPPRHRPYTYNLAHHPGGLLSATRLGYMPGVSFRPCDPLGGSRTGGAIPALQMKKLRHERWSHSPEAGNDGEGLNSGPVTGQAGHQCGGTWLCRKRAGGL